MSSDDRHDSLADQAAAWVPPWSRPRPADAEDADGPTSRRDTDPAPEAGSTPPRAQPPVDAPVSAPPAAPVREADAAGDPDPVREADAAGDPVAVLEAGGARGVDEVDPAWAAAGTGEHVAVGGSAEQIGTGEFTGVAETTAPDVPEEDFDARPRPADTATEPGRAAQPEPARAAEPEPERAGEPEPERAAEPDLAAEPEPAPRAEPAVASPPDAPRPVAPALPLIDDDELRGALEAILLVVDEPVSEIVLAQVLEQSTERVAAALERIARGYTETGHGFELRRAAGGWRLYTRPEYAAYVERFVLDGQSVRLTQAALETLAVVAYKQPVTRSRISAIRGVNCDGVIRTLVSRGLVAECGTEPDTGAFLYRTTSLFLEKLGLNTVDELPPLAPFLPDDLEEIADAPR